jgi:hypothetical protein
VRFQHESLQIAGNTIDFKMNIIMTVILTSKIYLEFIFGMPNLQYVEILIMYESNPTVHNSPAQGLVDMSLWG